MSTGRQSLLLATAALLSGCWYPEPSDMVSPPPRQRATHILSTTLRGNAALGAGESFEVVTNGEGVLSARFGPREVQRFVIAESPRAIFGVEEFPEGIGAFTLSVEGGWEEMRVDEVQIDVSPPRLLGVRGTRLGMSDRLAVDVWDSVMVRFAEITVGGQRQRVDLNRRSWGAAITVQFDTALLPEGHSSEVTVRVEDMAGNRLLASIPSLFVDRAAPTLQIIQPEPGAKVSGRFVVQIRSDDNLGPVTVALRASGSHLASLGAPDASAIIDASHLPRGPLVIEAIATDDVGNQSKSSQVTVEVE